MNSGIYKITCTANGKFYIGSSIHVDRRWKEHLRDLRVNKHRNKHLQNVYNKYGEEKLKFSLLESRSKGELIKLEQHYLDTHKPTLNLRPTAENQLGYKRSEESKLKARAEDTVNQRPVYQLNALSGEIIARYKKIKEAERCTGVRSTDISLICLNMQPERNRVTAGGYGWCYADVSEDHINEYRARLQKPNSLTRKRKILQLDRLTQTVIADYDSVYEATQQTGIQRVSIRKVCKGKFAHAGGYLWRYAE